jgi:outer membrane beta-barrel protein
MFRKTILILILLGSQAWGNQAKDSPKNNDKLDIKKLEEKYWAAKDDDFSVVQNRRYTKAQRYYLTVSGGVPFNDPHSTGSISSASFGYYFSERWGVEVNYSSATLKDNDSVSQFVGTYGVIPNYNVLKSNIFLSGSFVPFYAKMSMMDKSIIYFDMGINLGLGNLNYDIAQLEGPIAKNTLALKFAVFQQIFFTENFALRAELANSWSNQERLKYYAPGTTVGGSVVTGLRDLGNTIINDTSLLFGITYWF